MSDNWRNDLSASARAFLELAWPQIGPEIGGGDFVPCEKSNEPIASLLDQSAGIDGFQVTGEPSLMRSIACRMQPCDTAWSTFTIRYKRSTGSATEFEKRSRACLEKWHDWTKPTYTIQGYYSPHKNQLLSVGCIRTYDLFCFITQALARVAAGMHPDDAGVQVNTNTQDGNGFYVVRWSDLMSEGLPVIIMPRDAGTSCPVYAPKIRLRKHSQPTAQPTLATGVRHARTTIK